MSDYSSALSAIFADLSSETLDLMRRQLAAEKADRPEADELWSVVDTILSQRVIEAAV
jgi:hypothetical protein